MNINKTIIVMILLGLVVPCVVLCGCVSAKPAQTSKTQEFHIVECPNPDCPTHHIIGADKHGKIQMNVAYGPSMLHVMFYCEYCGAYWQVY